MNFKFCVVGSKKNEKNSVVFAICDTEDEAVSQLHEQKLYLSEDDQWSLLVVNCRWEKNISNLAKAVSNFCVDAEVTQYPLVYIDQKDFETYEVIITSYSSPIKINFDFFEGLSNLFMTNKIHMGKEEYHNGCDTCDYGQYWEVNLLIAKTKVLIENLLTK